MRPSKTLTQRLHKLPQVITTKPPGSPGNLFLTRTVAEGTDSLLVAIEKFSGKAPALDFGVHHLCQSAAKLTLCDPLRWLYNS